MFINFKLKVKINLNVYFEKHDTTICSDRVFWKKKNFNE